eukprot:10911-Heterococcus_DN1.PRE.2
MTVIVGVAVITKIVASTGAECGHSMSSGMYMHNIESRSIVLNTVPMVLHHTVQNCCMLGSMHVYLSVVSAAAVMRRLASAVNAISVICPASQCKVRLHKHVRVVAHVNYMFKLLNSTSTAVTDVDFTYGLCEAMHALDLQIAGNAQTITVGTVTWPSSPPLTTVLLNASITMPCSVITV